MCNISIEVFWDSSIAEINDLIVKYNRERKERFKEKAQFYFLLADLIDDRISRYLEEEAHEKIREWDVFPKLFEQEKSDYEKQKEEIEFENYKAQRALYIKEYNKRNGYE